MKKEENLIVPLFRDLLSTSFEILSIANKLYRMRYNFGLLLLCYKDVLEDMKLLTRVPTRKIFNVS